MLQVPVIHDIQREVLNVLIPNEASDPRGLVLGQQQDANVSWGRPNMDTSQLLGWEVRVFSALPLSQHKREYSRNANHVNDYAARPEYAAAALLSRGPQSYASTIIQEAI